MNKTAHPFEIAGMGTGPFVFVGMAKLPSAELAGQNPDAYNNALRDMPKLKSGCGTCSNCGMAIMNICIIRNSQGELYGVGTDCVEKTGDRCLADPAKVALAKLRREQAAKLRDERRAARAAQWRIDHADEIKAKADAEAARKQEMADRQAARRELFADLLPTLEASNDFHQSLARQLVFGPLSERQALYVAKAFFHRETSKNSEAFNKIIDRCIA